MSRRGRRRGSGSPLSHAAGAERPRPDQEEPMMALELDPRKTAVLCMDVQQFTVEHLPAARREALLAAIKRALDGARGAGVQVIYVVAERRADFSSPRN